MECERVWHSMKMRIAGEKKMCNQIGKSTENILMHWTDYNGTVPRTDASLCCPVCWNSLTLNIYIVERQRMHIKTRGVFCIYKYIWNCEIKTPLNWTASAHWNIPSEQVYYWKSTMDLITMSREEDEKKRYTRLFRTRLFLFVRASSITHLFYSFIFFSIFSTKVLFYVEVFCALFVLLLLLPLFILLLEREESSQFLLD